MPTLSDHELSKIVTDSLPGYRFVGSASAVDAPPALPSGTAATPSLSLMSQYYTRQDDMVKIDATVFREMSVDAKVKDFDILGKDDADQVMVLVSPDAPLAPGEKPHIKAAIISQKEKKIMSIQG
jgi:hypothetical protein